MISEPISLEMHHSTSLDPAAMERDLQQIHRRLDEYERDLTDYYAAARGGRPSAKAPAGEAASRPA
jgi:hypothetical protein